MAEETSKLGGMRMPAEEAEEFMALLMEAQTGNHTCIFAEYFRKIGNRMKSKYVQKT